MIERIARAICEDISGHLDPDATIDGINGEPVIVWQMYQSSAIAAIDAMHEPANGMLKAACASMSPPHRPTPKRVGSKEKHRIRYQAMIEAASKAS